MDEDCEDSRIIKIARSKISKSKIVGSYQSFEDIPIWKEARRLALEVYQLTWQDAFARDFALVGQIRRSAGSVMDNIAEGFERDSRLEFINFLSIAKGSAGEVRSQLVRALDLKYISEEAYEAIKGGYQQLSAHIANFIKYLNKTENKGNKFKDRVRT